MTLLIILSIFATYRIARMLAMEDGPLSVFIQFRERFDPQQMTWLGRGLNCPMCISFWVAFVFAAMVIMVSPPMTMLEYLIVWMGIAGGAAALYQAVG